VLQPADCNKWGPTLVEIQYFLQGRIQPAIIMTMSDLRCRERHRPGLAGPLLAIPDCHREHSQRRDLEGAVNRQLGRTTMKEEEKLNEPEDAAKRPRSRRTTRC